VAMASLALLPPSDGPYLPWAWVMLLLFRSWTWGRTCCIVG
jgi:hypothetical protein